MIVSKTSILRWLFFTPGSLLGLALLSLLWMPAAGLANENHADFVKHALWGLLVHQKEMNLSPEQLKKIKEIQLNYAKTHVKAESEVKLTKIEAMALKMDETSDLGAIESALQKHERAETVLHLEGVKAIRAAMGVLSPEQRENWKGNLMRLGMKLAHESGDHGDRY
jgi:periplasmic protein CpxP/Spy